jgi:hypothetical protein
MTGLPGDFLRSSDWTFSGRRNDVSRDLYIRSRDCAASHGTVAISAPLSSGHAQVLAGAVSARSRLTSLLRSKPGSDDRRKPLLATAPSVCITHMATPRHVATPSGRSGVSRDLYIPSIVRDAPVRTGFSIRGDARWTKGVGVTPLRVRGSPAEACLRHSCAGRWYPRRAPGFGIYRIRVRPRQWTNGIAGGRLSSLRFRYHRLTAHTIRSPA